MHLSHKPDSPALAETNFDTFLEIDIRAGVIVKAEAFPEARNPAYKLLIDFGPGVGKKKSAAQITVHYTLDNLVGRRVMGVVNFPARQIGPVRSEVLVLGFADQNGDIRLAQPDDNLPLGARLA